MNKTLKDKIHSIVSNAFVQDEDDLESMVIKPLLSLFEEMGTEVIGFDTEGDQLNNMLRAEQRKRMKELLGK